MTTFKEQCWAKVSGLIDEEGPGNAAQIEYDGLAGAYGETPDDPVWEEFAQALDAGEFSA